MRKSTFLLIVVIAFLAAQFSCGGSKKKPSDGSDMAGSGSLESDQSAPVLPPVVDEIPSDAYEMSEDAKGTYNDAVRAAQEGNIAKAEQDFKRVLNMDSRAFQAAYNLGVIAERNGDDEGALNYYKQAYAIQSNYSAAIKAHANIEIRRGNVDKAVELLRVKAAQHPGSIPILNAHANMLIEAKRYNEAIDVAKQVLKLDERNAEAMLRMGKANLRLGRYELTESILGQVLKINENVAEAYFLRAFIRLDEDLKSAAIEDFKLAIEKHPEYVEAMNNLGTLYLLSGNYTEAVAIFERAVQVSPSWGKLQLNYGNALRGTARWQESKAALEKVLDLDSRLKGAIFNMAILYYVATEIDGLERLGRLNEAERLFAQYKSAMGSDLEKDDPVYKYQKEVKVALEREERRIQTEKDRLAQEAERAAEREAAEESAAQADAGPASEEEGWENAEEETSDEDEGWY